MAAEPPRAPLTPAVIDTGLAAVDTFKRMLDPGADPTVEGDKALPFPSGWRAIQLPDAGTDSYFTKAFGRPAREQTCECERTAEPSVTQALHVLSGVGDGPGVPLQFNALARIRAIEVFPVPRGPAKR